MTINEELHLHLRKILESSSLLFLPYMYGCLACMHDYVAHACLVPAEARVQPSRTGVMDSCEQLCEAGNQSWT